MAFFFTAVSVSLSHSLIQPASEWWSQVISDYYYDIALKCSKVFISDLTFRLEEWWTQPRAFYCRIFNSGCPKRKGVNNMWICIYFYSNVFCLGIRNLCRMRYEIIKICINWAHKAITCVCAINKWQKYGNVIRMNAYKAQQGAKLCCILSP